jgi:2-(3-amino-3-carboxypropyl)histidine synthase
LYHIDEDKIFRTVEQRKPRRVLFNAPDGILPRIQQIATRISEKYLVDTVILADPTYGSCDTSEVEAGILGADLAFHVGHNITLDHIGKKTVLVDVYDDICFEETFDSNLDVLKDYNTLGLCTFAQHIPQIPRVKLYLEKKGFRVIVGRGKGQLHDGQVFGCEFYPVFDTKEEVDAFVVLGQSRFHAIGVALSSQKPTFMVDPYEKQIVDILPIAQDRIKKSILSLYKALDAQSFGVIIGLKEGQLMVLRALKIKNEMEKRGRKAQLLAMREITSDRLNTLTGFDAFIQTGCPRISIDGYSFSKPVLSAPQADALLNLMDGKEPGDYLLRSHWM